jgi:plasmid stabilization system protein ParE
MKKRTKPRLRFTDQAMRDTEWCRGFLQAISGTKATQRIREIQTHARLILDSPKLYAIEGVHPDSGLVAART